MEREVPSPDILLAGTSPDCGLVSGALLGRGSLGESAILLIGAGSCLLTATEVWPAVTVLKVAVEDLDGEPLNSWSLELGLARLLPVVGLGPAFTAVLGDLTGRLWRLGGGSGRGGGGRSRGGGGRGEGVRSIGIGGGGGRGCSD